ncbi:LCP family protein [Asaccharospora irregularis]|uniref:Cell envelope-related function transcriptional attenuator common domain-containing protein n=1 Tax=Asaccharospora irregularis DSM 2635 TaxID=1121321 RepID=A0A1M5K580_9FIRM|nr:LCP family protein [Asaccharospora irregularis]SHG47945.1 cell envelope-related function transcriptional attenuator common domain-containing protein [Asaccharospora irregularis DSM 2635]
MKNRKFILILIMFIFTSFVLETREVYSFDKGKDKNNKVDNILLIGEDDKGETGVARSDTMIILTINKSSKSIKLTSLTRDTLVMIPNKGYEKLNHAYAYGGPKLLLKTINDNFDIDIKDYAVVDFKSFIEIVDILDGVDISIDEREINHLNKVIETCYRLDSAKKGNIEYISTTGEHTLNGYQALAYARIRKIDTIYNRDQRQREILSSIAHKLSNTSIKTYPAIAKSLIKHVKVNISIDKIMKLAYIAHDFAGYDIEQMEFPKREYRSEGKIKENGMFVIKWDKEKNISDLKKFIYE